SPEQSPLGWQVGSSLFSFEAVFFCHSRARLPREESRPLEVRNAIAASKSAIDIRGFCQFRVSMHLRSEVRWSKNPGFLARQPRAGMTNEEVDSKEKSQRW